MALLNISICLSDIPKDKIKQSHNGKYYANFCVASRRTVSEYGETHTVYMASTKEERDQNLPTIFVGSGREYKPAIVTPENIDNLPAANFTDDLPF